MLRAALTIGCTVRSACHRCKRGELFLSAAVAQGSVFITKGGGGVRFFLMVRGGGIVTFL